MILKKIIPEKGRSEALISVEGCGPRVERWAKIRKNY
jgi:hypothetical protein